MIQTLPDDRLAKRNVAVLVAAQAILGGQMPMMFVVGGLAGGMLTGNPCFATLPISLIVFGSMTTAPWLSPLMQKYGRKAGFLLERLPARWGLRCQPMGSMSPPLRYSFSAPTSRAYTCRRRYFIDLPPPTPLLTVSDQRPFPLLWLAG